MKILFTHSYFLRFDPKQWELSQPYAPLGTLYACALIRQHGHEIGFYDTMFETKVNNIEERLELEKPELFVIYDDGFNYLTKMCLTNMREAAFEMIAVAKKRGCIVVVSSSDSTDHYPDYLKNGADFVLLGEAEATLLELAEAITSKTNDFRQIQGIAFVDNGKVNCTPRRQVLHDLDAIPFPAWDLVDMPKYKSYWQKSTGYFSLNLSTTRGCPFKCNWCAKPIYGNRYNSRSPQNVVNELIMLKATLGFEHIWFCDDIFGLKPGWIQEFAKEVKHAGLKFKYKIQSRADLLLQDNTIEALSASGCDNVWIGAESGSQKILDAMDKGITIAQIKEAAALLKKHLIKPSFFIQFGYPGETKEDIQKTIKMINEALPESIGVSVSYPLPGTKFYESVKEELKTKSNWTDSNELQLMFKNTYQPAFYKTLHKYVQNNHRKHLALAQLKKSILRPYEISTFTLRKLGSLLYYYPVLAFTGLKLKLLERN